MSDASGQLVSPDTLFRQYVEEECQRIAAGISSGNCPDFSAYRYECGRIEGLKSAWQFWHDAQGGVNIHPPEERRKARQ
jgi:hypothetical protein